MAVHDGASSSFSGSSTYDVFLNFRGEETRNNFTGFLHSALEREVIDVFIDSEDLCGGKEIKPALLEAIQQSKISISVFSKGYADSKWCLLELVEIVRCCKSNGQIILPIFFDVEPRDVRHQTGCFEGSFQKHKEKFDNQTIENWKEALTLVGGITGYSLKQVNENQSKLVKLVVERVLSELSSNRLVDVKNPIGLDARVEDLLSLLHVGSNDVRIVGICGIGGIGKTTIAKALYNRIFKSFRRSSFLANIREEASRPNGLVSLQEQLIYSISKRKVDEKIWNDYRGQQLIKERLQGENVLLILDDVDCRSQLDALAIEFNWYGPGSRIVITSRDEHILNLAKVDGDKIYWHKELNDEQSLQLFSLHAFSRDQPPEEYKQLSKDVLQLAGGLPLTLEVLGSSLFGISEVKVWHSILGELKRNPNKKVHNKLKISYDSLEANEKSIFLDAACFFVGWRKEVVISIWEACGFEPISAIKKLTQRSLLNFTNRAFYTYTGSLSSYEELRMHDQIQAMGRRIVIDENPMEPAKCSRLWSHDEILEVLEEHKGTPMIEGIVLFSNQIFPRVCIHSENITMMSKLRFLCIDEAHYEGDFLHLPSNVRWLHWRYPLEILPTTFYHKKLVHLDLSGSQIRQAWTNKPQNEKQLFQKLKVLHLRHCYHLSESPDFSWFPNLETLDLIWCKNMVKLHKSIGDLKYLVVLYLDETEIEELPNCICKLNTLKCLTLCRCLSLKRLPESIGDMKSLAQLLLDGANMEELPKSICKLSSLKRLTLRSCSSLKNLPQSIGEIKSLVQLSLDGTKIKELPYSICGLSSLKSLSLKSCSSLKELPERIGDLTSLVELWLCGTKIERLPNSTCRLSSLQKLDLDGCESLNLLPESVGDLKSLVELCLGQTKIKELPNGVGLLEKLEVLSVRGCNDPVKLPVYGGRMRSRRIFNLIGTRILLSPDDFLVLHNLVELKIGNKFESSLPPWVIGLPKLQKLLLQGYTRLKSLPRLPPTLTSLFVADCHSVQKLPDLSGLRNLRHLSLHNCEKLEEIRGLEETESLEDLYVHDCNTITDTPRKKNGQGTLLIDGLWRNDSLNVNDGIHKGLILCLVFAFTFYEQKLQGSLQEGELVNIQLHLEASIRRKEGTNCCNIGLVIKGIEFTTKRDLVYIHHFKGFDWFGLPLKGTSKIGILSVKAERLREAYEHRDFVNCEVRFWKLFFESSEFEHQMPDEESSASMVADFFKWSFHDAGRSPSNIGKGMCIISVPSSYDDDESSCDEGEGSGFAPKEMQRSNLTISSALQALALENLKGGEDD